MDVQISTTGFLAKVRDHKALRDQVRFYAPLRSSLRFCKSIGPAIFVRAGTSSATWADGAPHTVEANQPRFEWDDQGRPLGIGLVLGESLMFSPANALHDGNTLCWIQEGEYKSTTSAQNPFDSSGTLLLFQPNAHYCEIIKFKKVLNASEEATVKALLADLIIATSVIGEPPTVPVVEQFGTITISAGALQVTVSHTLLSASLLWAGTPNWPTKMWIAAGGKSSTGVTVQFSVPAPAGGGSLDWGGVLI